MKTCVITIFYNPSRTQVNYFLKLSTNFPVIIVDNSALEVNITTSENLHYIYLNHNCGIAKAQNEGLELAHSLGYDTFVIFDQDTQVTSDYINRICDEFERIKNQDSSIASLGPLLIDRSTGREYKNCVNGDFSKVEAIMASGSIISDEALSKVGYMEERLFIDLVDSEWCWRAASKGYSIYQTKNVELIHSVGKKYIYFWGFPFFISDPSRYYFQYRNAIWMLKRSYVPSKWKIKIIIRKTFELFFIPIVVCDRRNTLTNIFRGIKDGLNKEMNYYL